MKIEKVTSQHRNDFWATMLCEHCGYRKEDVSGYDDINFHYTVIPGMYCPKCSKNRAGDVGIIINNQN